MNTLFIHLDVLNKQEKYPDTVARQGLEPQLQHVLLLGSPLLEFQLGQQAI
jgi:hypothetical protein